MQAVLIVGSETMTTGKESGAELLAELNVGGLSILRRQMRAAVTAGATRLLIVCPDPEAMAVRYANDPVATVPTAWRPAARRTVFAAASLLDVRDDLEPRFWVSTVDRVLTSKAFAMPEEDTNQALRVVDDTGAGTGVFVGDTLMLDYIERNPDEELGAAITRDLEAPGAVWFPVRGAADRSGGEKALMRALRKPLGRDADGLAAYYINRPISLRLSRLLVYSPLTPNQITAFALLVGVAGSWFAAGVEWWSVALAALLLQVSSVLDGVDGEIARLRMTSSTSGEWFDTVCDDVINVSFMGGLGYTAWARTGQDFYGSYTAVAVIAGTLLALVLYRELIRAGVASHNHLEWGFEKEDKSETLQNPIVSKILVGFSYIAKRDSYTILLMLLLFADMPVAAFLIMATGTIIIFAGFVVQKLTSGSAAG
jgi:phosphatidylglycerophosphate synthase